MVRSFVFPGQGSQAVGMGKDLADAFPEAREIFQEVDDAIDTALFKLMCDGPSDELTLTENAQPALMAVSLAVTRVLEAQGGFKLAEKAQFVAGHSLGEYSALAAAGALSVADTARLLKRRGQAMQAAVPVGQGAMAAILGLDWDDVVAVAAAASSGGLVCAAANDNSVGQVVISGHKEAVETAIKLATEKGAKKAMGLPVSAPFHCALMQPAADAMAEGLADVALVAPQPALVANVTASSVTDPDEIKSLLVQQVTGTVRWRESMLYMKKQNVEQIVELGSGKVLSGLVRRIDRSLKGVAVQGPQDIESFLSSL